MQRYAECWKCAKIARILGSEPRGRPINRGGIQPMKRTLLTVCGLALAAAPLAAGTVYVPVAINETEGAYKRTTEVWATNPDAAIQGFVIRRLASSTNGTTRVSGDEIGP